MGRLSIARASGSIGAGKYRVFANLGRGGMADVLLGVAQGPKGFNKLLVVKRLRPVLAEDPAMVSMFLDEARLAARLNHPNLIHTYEIGEEAGGYFIAMEYLEGRTLSLIFDALRETSSSLPPWIWAKILAEALAGLHHAHELCDYDGSPLQIVHRDVSPQNVIVTFEGRVKLVDFGIAKARVNVTETEKGIVKGKIAYMSPEQAQISEELDRRADIFSAGIVLWECLTMSRLITGDAASAAFKIKEMAFPRPSSVNAEVPPELDAITMKALERDPANRYQTAEDMRAALEKYLRESGHFVHEADIGGPVAKLFEEQREDVKSQIRMHMQNLASSSGGDLAPPPSSRRFADETLSSTTPGGASKEGVEWAKEAAGIPRLPSITESARSVRAVLANTRPSKAPRARGVVLAVSSAGALAIVGALIALSPRGANDAATSRASSSEAAAAASASAPPVTLAQTMHLEVTASPATATLTLDDAAITNPFSGSFGRDAVEHRLQASCPGYATEARLVRFDAADVRFELNLQKVAEVAPKPKGKAPPQAAPKPTRPPLDKDPYQ